MDNAAKFVDVLSAIVGQSSLMLKNFVHAVDGVGEGSANMCFIVIHSYPGV